jgi:hypothetical protein
MAIRALSAQEFTRFNSARATVARHTDKAVEWFADDAGTVFGAITYQQLDLAWSLVVLRRDHHGNFRALDRDAGLRDLDDARRVLVEKMALRVATGDQVSSPRPAA